jgi:hypothetical protein
MTVILSLEYLDGGAVAVMASGVRLVRQCGAVVGIWSSYHRALSVLEG